MGEIRSELLFFIIILLANIIQGITGFAGTILAMPFSIMLVGYDTAKPVLNVLGLFSGIYVFAGNRKAVDWKEFKKIVLIMALSIFAGMGIRELLSGRESLLYHGLGVFVIVIALQGLYQKLVAPKRPMRTDGSECITLAGNPDEEKTQRTAGSIALQGTAGEDRERVSTVSAGSRLRIGLDLGLLVVAGIVHGIFVSGGPLLIGYLTRRIRDKTAFRATISTVWIVLNGIILVGDIRSGLWTVGSLQSLAVAIPFLLGGMFIGGKLYRVMSQKVFMLLTYVLLFISGVSLLCK